jgi:hypothetical protein
MGTALPSDGGAARPVGKIGLNLCAQFQHLVNYPAAPSFIQTGLPVFHVHTPQLRLAEITSTSPRRTTFRGRPCSSDRRSA